MNRLVSLALVAGACVFLPFAGVPAFSQPQFQPSIGNMPQIGNLAMVPISKPDLPVWVASTNSSKLAMMTDMKGGGWIELSGYDGVRQIWVDAGAGRIYLASGSAGVGQSDISGGGRVFFKGPIVFASGVARDSKGRIYVVDSTQGCLYRMDDMSGAGLVSFGTKGQENGQFSSPAGCFVDSLDRIYVADMGNHRIVRIADMDGSEWRYYKGAGATRLYWPEQVWVDRKGRLYIPDGENRRIVRIDDMEGTGFITRGDLVYPLAVCVDRYDRIYVADGRSGVVSRMDDMEGHGLVTWGNGVGESGSIFDRPASLFVVSASTAKPTVIH